MKTNQLLFIVLALIAGGAAGVFISKSTHQCESAALGKGLDAKKPGKRKIDAAFAPISPEMAASMAKSFYAWKKGTDKGGVVKFGGFINRHAVAALLETIPDSVQAIKYVICRRPNGQLGVALIGGGMKPMNYSVEASTDATAGAFVIDEDYVPTDSSQTYCPPMCSFFDFINSQYPPIVIDAAVTSTTGGTATEEEEK